MIIDSAGICYWAFLLSKNELISQLIRDLYGIDFKEKELISLARAALLEEKEFNEKVGISKRCDRLPEFLERETVPPENTMFDIPYYKIDKLFTL